MIQACSLTEERKGSLRHADILLLEERGVPVYARQRPLRLLLVAHIGNGNGA